MAQKSFLFELPREAPLSVDELASIEAEMQVRLPEAYREHLIQYGAGDFAFGSVYSPNPQSPMSLWNEYRFAAELHGKHLPFADNGGGDYLCFPIRDGVAEDTVVWADHEDDYAISPSEYADFREFILQVCLRE